MCCDTCHVQGTALDVDGSHKGTLKSLLSVCDLSNLPFSLSLEDLGQSQHDDLSLAEMFNNTLSSADILRTMRGYFVHDGVLYHKWVPHVDGLVGEAIIQLVVPTKYRKSVLQVAHDQSGHSGVWKTYDCLLRNFFWPRLKREVATYIKTCHTCQVTGKPNQTLKLVLLHPVKFRPGQ